MALTSEPKTSSSAKVPFKMPLSAQVLVVQRAGEKLSHLLLIPWWVAQGAAPWQTRVTRESRPEAPRWWGARAAACCPPTVGSVSALGSRGASRSQQAASVSPSCEGFADAQHPAALSFWVERGPWWGASSSLHPLVCSLCLRLCSLTQPWGL